MYIITNLKNAAKNHGDIRVHFGEIDNISSSHENVQNSIILQFWNIKNRFLPMSWECSEEDFAIYLEEWFSNFKYEDDT